MLEVELTDHHGPTATGSGRKENKAVASAASESFARWLHCTTDMSPSHRLRCGGISFHGAIHR